MHKRTAFTLVEILVSLAIIVVLVAILVPVIRSAKRSALETDSIHKLKSLHTAISLYRIDWGGDDYGTSYAMGLPPNGDFWEQYGSGDFPRPKGTAKPGRPTVYVRWWPIYIESKSRQWNAERQKWWAEYTSLYLSDSVLNSDMTFDDSDAAYMSPHRRKKGIGMYLGGHVRRIIKVGDWNTITWWNDEDKLKE